MYVSYNIEILKYDTFVQKKKKTPIEKLKISPAFKLSNSKQTPKFRFV